MLAPPQSKNKIKQKGEPLIKQSGRPHEHLNPRFTGKPQFRSAAVSFLNNSV